MRLPRGPLLPEDKREPQHRRRDRAPRRRQARHADGTDSATGPASGLGGFERFQQAWERPEPALEHTVEKALALRALGGRFGAVAAAVVRSIVAEYALPDALKTLPPLHKCVPSRDTSNG